MNEQQKQLLSEPLQKSAVKERSGGGGRSLSYIEGWHAIAEANRIFGFDGWSSETTALEKIADGKDNKGRCTVTFSATVTIRVGDIVRQGCGAGHGRDFDHGTAMESALKEAETDARKRALMTFGNQFGLALYDKTQANVVAASAPPMQQKATKPKFEQQKEWIKSASKVDLGEANIKLAKATGLTDAQKLELRQMIEERLLAK